MKSCLLSAAALLVATGPLRAQEPEEGSRVVTVSYRDLDFTRPEDRSSLDRRLRGAARSACRGTAPDGRRVEPAGPLAWVSLARCERATLAPARAAAALAASEAGRRPLLAQRAPAR